MLPLRWQKKNKTRLTAVLSVLEPCTESTCLVYCHSPEALSFLYQQIVHGCIKKLCVPELDELVSVRDFSRSLLQLAQCTSCIIQVR